jgi:hypothetical protein
MSKKWRGAKQNETFMRHYPHQGFRTGQGFAYLFMQRAFRPAFSSINAALKRPFFMS